MTHSEPNVGQVVTAEVDLWSAPLRQRLREDEVSLCRSVLSIEERAAVGRFHDIGRREQALVGRALLRRALTHRLGAPPERWAFETGERGRPYLAQGQTDRPVDFSLAHTNGYVLCAVSEGAKVGVDVEPLSRASELRKIATRFLAESEILDLARLAPEAQDKQLVRLWTLKEAYSKALGLGLAMPYDETPFCISVQNETTKIETKVAPGWRFYVFSASADFILSLALRAPNDVAEIAHRDGFNQFFSQSQD